MGDDTEHARKDAEQARKDSETARKDSETARKDKVFRGVMFGLMAGSATFLAERYILKLAPETSLIPATFIAVALAVFLLKRIEPV